MKKSVGQKKRENWKNYYFRYWIFWCARSHTNTSSDYTVCTNIFDCLNSCAYEITFSFLLLWIVMLSILFRCMFNVYGFMLMNLIFEWSWTSTLCQTFFINLYYDSHSANRKKMQSIIKYRLPKDKILDSLPLNSIVSILLEQIITKKKKKNKNMFYSSPTPKYIYFLTSKHISLNYKATFSAHSLHQQ